MNERKKHLLETLKGLNKSLGSQTFGFADESPDKEVISFGVTSIDNFMGGGVPRGKFTCDFGAEDTGKSTRALHLVANAQKNGLICAYLDLERKFDKERAESMGVQLDELVLSQILTSADDAMDAIRALSQEKVVDLIVVDSIQAMSPKGEQESKKGVEKSIGDDQMALLARVLGKFFRVVSPDIFRAKIAVYLIGQIRTNLGGFFAYADLSGGNALKHWLSLCIFSRKGQKADAPTHKIEKEIETPDGIIKKKVSEPIGFDCVLKMVKSHITDAARENAEIHLPFYYKTGFHAPLSVTNPYATDEEGLKKAVETSSAIEGIKVDMDKIHEETTGLDNHIEEQLESIEIKEVKKKGKRGRKKKNDTPM